MKLTCGKAAVAAVVVVAAAAAATTVGVRAPTRCASRRRSGDADRRDHQCTFILNAERIVCICGCSLSVARPSASSRKRHRARAMSVRRA